MVSRPSINCLEKRDSIQRPRISDYDLTMLGPPAALQCIYFRGYVSARRACPTCFVDCCSLSLANNTSLSNKTVTDSTVNCQHKPDRVDRDMFPLEVPVFSPRSASLAIAQHAARVELNRDGSYPEGGLTPTVADLEQLIATYKGTSCAAAAPIRIMIRPRGPPAAAAAGPDFVYSDAEFAEMKAAIRAFRESGLMSLERGDGFVFGCVRELSAGAAVVVVDIGRNRELGALARPFPSVFHRAFVSYLDGPLWNKCLFFFFPFRLDVALLTRGEHTHTLTQNYRTISLVAKALLSTKPSKTSHRADSTVCSPRAVPDRQ